MIEVFEKVTELLRGGATIALASIISAAGSTPQRSGARMIVDASGKTFFTVGGGGFEAAVVKDALRAIAGRASVIKEYNLSGAAGDELEMACGGRATVVIEVLSPPQRLVIFGAGHVGRALALTAGDLGFAVSLVDDREEHLSPELYPEGVELVRAPSEYDGELPELDGSCYVVILTRSHLTDYRVLNYAVGRSTAYLGMIGSERKVAGALKRLKAEGVAAAALDRVRAPIGLDIGSKTPKEIAISILAEVIRARNQQER
jgi:xanthine dehydrogenase accessory factor